MNKKQGWIRTLLIVFLIGIVADKWVTADVSTHSYLIPYPSDLRFGFFLLLPLTVGFLLAVFEIFHVRRSFIIVATTMLSFVGVALLVFWFYSFRHGGPPSDMYGVVYLVAPIVAAPVGALFGLHLARQLRKPEISWT